MSRTKSLEVRLVEPVLAEKLQRSAFSSLGTHAGEGATRLKLAQALLTHLQNRHVGITPQLAAGFALWVTAPESAPFPWNQIQKRLLAALSFDGKDSNARLSIPLNQAPLYAALRIAAPMITQACLALGTSYLFAQDPVGAQVNAKEYERYHAALAQQIFLLTQDPTPGWELFWKESALTLSSFSLQERRGNVDLDTLLRGDGREEPPVRRHAFKAKRAVLPVAEPFAASFFFQELRQLRPNEPSRVVKRIVSIVQKYTTRRIREGGIRGIQLTRRIEDLDLILMSEFLNPPIILADRLLNTGYLAREREPKRERFRDFLLVGFMPAQVGDTISAALIKFAWYQALLGLSILLRRSKLHASQFVWIEGNAQGGARRADFYLDQLKVYPTIGDQVTNPSFRHEFLTLLQWLPTFLDARETFTPLVPIPARQSDKSQSEAEAQSQEVSNEPEAWVKHAAQHFLLAPLANQFGFVHYMLFLPVEMRAEKQRHFDELRGKLAAELGLGMAPGRNLSITRVPVALQAGDEWGYRAKGTTADSLIAHSADEQRVGDPQEDIAEKLSTLWLKQFIREIWSE